MYRQLKLFSNAPYMAERNRKPCLLDEDFENVRKEQNMQYQLKREKKGVK